MREKKTFLVAKADREKEDRNKGRKRREQKKQEEEEERTGRRKKRGLGRRGNRRKGHTRHPKAIPKRSKGMMMMLNRTNL